MPVLSHAEGPELALDDLRVIDLSQGIAGPYCTKLLADCGAAVVKVEPPQGDYTRTLGPFPGDIPHHKKGGLFIHLNGNKKSVTLDIETESGRTVLRKLLVGANCQILLHPVKNPQAFGIAEFVDGRVARIVEKPASPPSNLAVIGIYMFDRHVFEAVERIKPSARGELEITDTIQHLIDNGLDVRAEVLDRYWIDTGKMDDILEANRMVLETLTPRNEGEVDERTRVYEPVILEKGATVVNSVLRGPLVVGAETEIVDSYVGPFTAINHHCRLEGVRVGGSIVLEHTTIEHPHWPIEHSLIGRYVTLRGGQAVGGAYSLNLGDHSQIEMPEG